MCRTICRASVATPVQVIPKIVSVMPTGNRDGSRSRLPPHGKPPSDRDYKNFMKWLQRERDAGRPHLYDRYHSHEVQTRTFAKQEM